MPATSIRVVLDTNVLLRGLLNSGSAAGKLLEMIDKRQVLLLLSKPLLDEYRAVLSDPGVLQRFPDLTDGRVKLSLKRLRYFCEYFGGPSSKFLFERDPRDEKLIELAIAGKATDIVSSDKDLLSLPTGHGEGARRFRQRLPKVRVQLPGEFLDFYSEELST